jgi:hypothetical protein
MKTTPSNQSTVEGPVVFIESLSLFNDFFNPCDLVSSKGTRNEMSLALERFVAPQVGRPQPTTTEDAESRLNISVIYTGLETTLAALKQAGALASSLGARITLVATQLVPFPLPLTTPPVLSDFNEQRFRVIAGQSRVETKVSVYLCRDRMGTLKTVLRPHSLVVIGGSKRWWPTPEKRLAAKLRQAGHEVIFSEME